MRKKIHKKDLPIVQQIYNKLLFFTEQEYFHTCDISLSECPIWSISEKKNPDKGYRLHAFCSFDVGEEPIVPLENAETVMLRLYTMTLDGFKFLSKSGESMVTFLGIPALGKNQDRHVWIKIIVIGE